MKKNTIANKLGFCITCMNRLHHLKETIKKNIEDNFIPDKVEFILLDYNSTDNLEKWVVNNLKIYIDQGILTYYKTLTPTSYLRSHSRNMAFRLSSSQLVCNLDADNFLGKGFADYMINEFSNKSNFFYTSNYNTKDIVGRLCVNKLDFMNVKGYNEAFIGYGFEDVELYDRLKKYGLKQLLFHDNRFSKALSHSNIERISQEIIISKISEVYLSYLTPFSTKVLLLYNDSKYEFGTIFDNYHLNISSINELISINDKCMDERFRIVVGDDWIDGECCIGIDSLALKSRNHFVNFKINKLGLINDKHQLYKITDYELIINIILLIAEALNFKRAKEISNRNDIINKNGFGKGVVYKNFNYEQVINLE